MVRGAALASNLPQLQRLIKIDPDAYREEFLQQWNHYNTIRQIFFMDPGEPSQRYRELVSFISQVANCFPKETAEFPTQISSVLLDKYECLCTETRMALVQTLVILRKKGVVTPLSLLNYLFPLLPSTSSHQVRTFIQKAIVTDIRQANIPSKNHKLNAAFQNMLFGLIVRGTQTGPKGNEKGGPTIEMSRDDSALSAEAALWAVLTTKELWSKRTWTEDKALSIMENGCFHISPKVQMACLHFFLGESEDDSDDEPQQDTGNLLKSLHRRKQVTNLTRGAAKKLDRQIKQANKQAQPKTSSSTAKFSTIQIIRDPQAFVERLYEFLLRKDKSLGLDHKILVMRLLSLVLGAHRLCVLGFYTYILRYLTVRQTRVSAILVSVAQSIHTWTPPDVISPVVRKLAQEFLHPGVSSEVVVAGLNCIREVCKRQPCCMERDLLSDLVEYKKSKDKGVSMAARALQHLYRQHDPGLLAKTDRGKPQVSSFGQSEPSTGIDSLLLLENHLRKADQEHGSAPEAGWQDWEEASESSVDTDSDGWIDVSSDGAEDLHLDDDESGDEKTEKEMTMTEEQDHDIDPSSMLVTSQILTPADFKLLGELREQAAKAAPSGRGTKRKFVSEQRHDDQQITAEDITGPQKRTKADYAARVSSVAQGREGREKYSVPKKALRSKPSSSTNKQKTRNKPLLMVMSGNQKKKKGGQRRSGKSKKGVK